MWRHLHHLNGLRCFEAAARHASFTRAAGELHVTQAAVSHQIRGLENSLGVSLFERRPRQVKLTPAGAKLASVLSHAFDRIDQAMRELHRQNETSLLLAVTPSFSAKWLVPRLPRFWDMHPELALHLHHTVQLDALARGEADAAIVWSTRRPEKVWGQRLFGTRLTPVCSPVLTQSGPPLDRPAALSSYLLLHEDGYDDWERWLAKACAQEVDAHRGPIIDDTNSLLLSAMGGRGVALGRTALIEEDLKLGRLLRPFELSIEADGAYWLIASEATAEQLRFKILVDFLNAEECNTEPED
ncbi:LysR substrate-binding domain-containing protein [Chromobacterium haemolyticum]|uniref:LysR substrate-binding domain-containing protein n=1 Tax=Chromobacterium haemolyticum TaxID=394935 RepID=UPI004057582B